MRNIMRIGKVTLAIVLLSAIVIPLIYVVLPAKAVPLDTYHSSWYLVRETADEDGVNFGAVYDLTTTSNFASKDSSSVANGGPYRIRSYYGGTGSEYISSGGAWMFALCGKNYEDVDDTFSFHILGWSRENGMLQVIAEGDAVLGDQAVITYPDDGADAVGALVDMDNVAYTHSDKTFTKTDVGVGVVVGMMIYTTSSNDSNLTPGYYAVTGRTDNTIVCSGTGSYGNVTATVQANPSFWCDVINLDETTKWPSVAVYNSEAGTGQMAFIVVDTTGLEWVQFVVYAADASSSDEAGDVTIYGRRY